VPWSFRVSRDRGRALDRDTADGGYPPFFTMFVIFVAAPITAFVLLRNDVMLCIFAASVLRS
jgi:hypothetical protein